MASKTYRLHGLVLRRTKLGEKDLIVELLDQDGSLHRAVAKGARKPGGSHAARTEPYATVDALMAEGRSLDVLCEAKLAGGVRPANLTLEQAAAMAPVAELLSCVAQEDLVQPRLFDLAQAVFLAIAEAEACATLALAAAGMWKVVAQAGFRPELSACVACGRLVSDGSLPGSFSAAEGGVLCAVCAAEAKARPASPQLIGWCSFLLGSRLVAIAERPPDAAMAHQLVLLARDWIAVHIGRRMRSVDFLTASGLFPASERSVS